MANNGSSVASFQHDFLDLHGQQVHAFSLEIANVGFSRMAELLLSMLRSGAWRSYKDGQGQYNFLPGEFDYFLSQRGVQRGEVMDLPDIDAKAELEEAMDERCTGKEGIRRPILQVRAENPQVPGRPIEPYGYTPSEAKALFNSGTSGARRGRMVLGTRVRRYTNTGGATTKTARDELPRVERLRRSAFHLDDGDLADLIDALKQEQRRRKRHND